MPRYYFHIKDGAEIRDHIGSVLPDIEAAKIEASKSSLEIIRDLGEKFWKSELWMMIVTDENGVELFRLEFKGTMRMSAEQSAPLKSVDAVEEPFIGS